MASMTDFIESINVADEPSVYNEDYSWAEEYSEYFNDVSDNYIQPIFESSGYQFFGEATFYQEAHKGLIAGGILALVSGAFFMIMKLLRNGGSGGSSASSNDSAKKDVAKRRAKATEEIYKKAEKDVEAKRKEYETAKEEIKSKPPKTETIDDKKPEPSKPREYSKLDDEENLTYNFTMIFNKLAATKPPRSSNNGINEIKNTASSFGNLENADIKNSTNELPTGFSLLVIQCQLQLTYIKNSPL